VGLSELPLDPGSETWRVLAPRGVRPEFGNPLAFDYDPGRDRFVLVSSQGQVRYLVPTAAADPPPVQTSARPVPVPAFAQATSKVDRVDGLALDVLSNPVRGGVLALHLEIGGDSPGLLEVIDVRGRVVTRELAVPGVRLHETKALASRPPGIYFARLARDGRQVVRKLVLTR
jgi:hypothetical protein